MEQFGVDRQPDGPIYYLDTLSGEVLVGDAAYDEHVEAGGQPADIVNIRDILSGRIDVKLDATCLPTIEFNKETCISIGHWLLRIYPEAREGLNPLSTTLLSRASAVGLSATPKMIVNQNRFGSLADYNRAVGVEPG